MLCARLPKQIDSPVPPPMNTPTRSLCVTERKKNALSMKCKLLRKIEKIQNVTTPIFQIPCSCESTRESPLPTSDTKVDEDPFHPPTSIKVHDSLSSSHHTSITGIPSAALTYDAHSFFLSYLASLSPYLAFFFLTHITFIRTQPNLLLPTITAL